MASYTEIRTVPNETSAANPRSCNPATTWQMRRPGSARGEPTQQNKRGHLSVAPMFGTPNLDSPLSDSAPFDAAGTHSSSAMWAIASPRFTIA
jgi:hypothetical protein